MKYKVQYDNDTGPEDDYFVSWYTVESEDGGFTIKMDSEQEAKKLCAFLNEHNYDYRIK